VGLVLGIDTVAERGSRGVEDDGQTVGFPLVEERRTACSTPKTALVTSPAEFRSGFRRNAKWLR